MTAPARSQFLRDLRREKYSRQGMDAVGAEGVVGFDMRVWVDVVARRVTVCDGCGVGNRRLQEIVVGSFAVCTKAARIVGVVLMRLVSLRPSIVTVF